MEKRLKFLHDSEIIYSNLREIYIVRLYTHRFWDYTVEHLQETNHKFPKIKIYKKKNIACFVTGFSCEKSLKNSWKLCGHSPGLWFGPIWLLQDRITSSEGDHDSCKEKTSLVCFKSWLNELLLTAKLDGIWCGEGRSYVNFQDNWKPFLKLLDDSLWDCFILLCGICLFVLFIMCFLVCLNVAKTLTQTSLVYIIWCKW